MKLGYTILYVDDVVATIEFYEKAFGFARTVVVEGSYGELDTGATKLAFAAKTNALELFPVPLQPAGKDTNPPAFEVGFVTDDVQAAFDVAVKAGATALAPPKQKPWGQTVAYVRDLNGFLVELCTPMG
ncbi:MAG: VOC family protein [Deltaproteobacteria bacterium]|nr:VOC family protein [Deltaproteobacteria bacterium]